MTTARDVMTHPVLTLSRATPLAEAARLLADRGISGAPVCDAAGRVVGVLSKGDLAEVYTNERAERRACVGDVMDTEVLEVAPEEDLGKVLEGMVFEGAHRAVVVDAADCVVGIVTPLDLLRAIAEPASVRFEARRASGSRFVAWPTR